MTFTAAASWSTFDTTQVNADAKRFKTAAFDGRYVYFLPDNHNWPNNGVVARYDTRTNFNATTSWSAFDLQTVFPTANGRGANFFIGGAFDGRYVYLVPWGGGSVMARFDARTPSSMPKLPAWYGSFF